MLFRGIKYHLKHQNQNAVRLLSVICSANEIVDQSVLLEYAQMVDMSEELLQVGSFNG